MRDKYPELRQKVKELVELVSTIRAEEIAGRKPDGKWRESKISKEMHGVAFQLLTCSGNEDDGGCMLCGM